MMKLQLRFKEQVDVFVDMEEATWQLLGESSCFDFVDPWINHPFVFSGLSRFGHLFCTGPYSGVVLHKELQTLA